MSYSTLSDSTSYTDSVHDAAKELNVNIPSEFLCPITMEVMKHPLMTREGFNFERKAILDWLSKGTGYCPLTRAPLDLSDLVPNKALEQKIARWMWEYCLPSPRDEDENDDNDDVIVLGYARNENKHLQRHDRRALRSRVLTAIRLKSPRTN